MTKLCHTKRDHPESYSET